MNDNELKNSVEKYAEDETAYHDSFASAFVKLLHLGHEDE